MLRGIATLTAFGLAVEVGDWLTGSCIGAYLGLVPTESSSGASRSQGSTTKTGNTHARRLLVEAAWHHIRLRAVSHSPAIATDASREQKEHEGIPRKAMAGSDREKDTRPSRTAWQIPRHRRVPQGTLILRQQRKAWSERPQSRKQCRSEVGETRHARNRQRAPPSAEDPG